MEKLTPWFPADVKPVRVGVYQTKVDALPGERFYNYWDGGSWHGGESTPAVAYKHCDYQPDGVDYWRGLSRKPRSRA
jgi:hypothetical protein